MRITGGRYSGRRVTCPPGVIRPAMDRMRESVFAILGPLDGLSFLDLFSGSGVVGIEAASRGAARVVLVERDRKKRSVMEENARIVWDEAGDGPVELSIRSMPAERVLGGPSAQHGGGGGSQAGTSQTEIRGGGSPAAESPEPETFDIVFADPPFKYRDKAALLRRIDASPLVRDDTRILIHYPAEDDLPEGVGALVRYDHRRYGRSQVGFYRRHG
jgi:16S rRNA G966 N2-methylase RsmD